MIWLAVGVSDNVALIPGWAVAVTFGVVCGWFARGRFRKVASTPRPMRRPPDLATRVIGNGDL